MQINLKDFFKNTEEERCPIVKCFALDKDCLNTAPSEIEIKNGYEVHAKSNVFVGYSTEVCVKCITLDASIGLSKTVGGF